ncbi:transporter substrate-binding domain-containing protein [Rhizobium sp. Root491]|uniref:transporter substrate-binding domain-containing protein n=1 Tax=Rhizobium sp. Root491 TaxID=1736548 RepID=UPI000A9E9EA2|nr:transporter substrate-binding domain-containing protein [Rhizobium sp. Root491]
MREQKRPTGQAACNTLPVFSGISRIRFVHLLRSPPLCVLMFKSFNAVVVLIAGLVIFPFITSAASAQAQLSEARLVNVGVYVSPPFVVADNNRYDGMATDLWEAVASDLNLATRYVAYPTLRELVDATSNGEVDAAVTNLTITSARAQLLAFTQPWYDAGLRLMVPSVRSSGFDRFLSGLSDAGHLQAYGWLLAVIAAATIGFTLFDRKFDPEFPKRWHEGAAESFHHVISIATKGKTSGRKNLFGWIGRIWQTVWMLVGVGIIAYVTSSITSVMTTVAIERGIHSVADLPGKTVGVFKGSASEEFIAATGIVSRSYQDIDAAVSAMNKGEIDAIVGDAPVLEYYVHSRPFENVAAVGKIFHPDKYGFAFRADSDLVQPVTLQLLKRMEDGTVEKLRNRYFGNTD